MIYFGKFIAIHNDFCRKWTDLGCISDEQDFRCVAIQRTSPAMPLSKIYDSSVKQSHLHRYPEHRRDYFR